MLFSLVEKNPMSAASASSILLRANAQVGTTKTKKKGGGFETIPELEKEDTRNLLGEKAEGDPNICSSADEEFAGASLCPEKSSGFFGQISCKHGPLFGSLKKLPSCCWGNKFVVRHSYFCCN